MKSNGNRGRLVRSLLAFLLTTSLTLSGFPVSAIAEMTMQEDEKQAGSIEGEPQVTFVDEESATSDIVDEGATVDLPETEPEEVVEEIPTEEETSDINNEDAMEEAPVEEETSDSNNEDVMDESEQSTDERGTEAITEADKAPIQQKLTPQDDQENKYETNTLLLTPMGGGNAGSAAWISLNSYVSDTTRSVFASESKNWYIFTLPSAGKVSITYKTDQWIDKDNFAFNFTIKDYALDNELLVAGFNGNSLVYRTSNTVGLPAGTYLISQSATCNTGTSFRFKVNYSSNNAWEQEPNDYPTNALRISLGKKYFGNCISYSSSKSNYDDDYYCFTLPKRTSVTVSVGSEHDHDDSSEYYRETWYVRLYEASQVGGSQWLWGDSVKSYLVGDTKSSTVTLNAGTYYLLIWGSRNPSYLHSSYHFTVLDNSHSITSATISPIASHPYTGKAITPRPTVKIGSTTLKLNTDYTLSYKNNVKIGTATVTVTGKGAYSGSKSVTFKIAAPTVSYRTHVQNVGWQGWKKNGAMSGTSGRALRLEGINIKLENKPVSGGITYRTHVQNIGWQGWRSDGAMSGTSGKALRLEAIQIKLTGKMAEKYDIYYRVHCQNIGWMGWAKNGQSAGSAGYAYRLEGIQVVLVPKGKSAPSATYKGITANTKQRFSQR